MMKTIATCFKMLTQRVSNTNTCTGDILRHIHVGIMAKEAEKVVKLYACRTDNTAITGMQGNGWESQIKAAVQSLKANGIIGVPTDTIYGIAGLAQSTKTVEKIYNIKNRDTAKPIAICVGDITDIEKWGKLTISSGLLSELLPGPVTIVLERTVALNPRLNPGTSLVGIRVPDYGFVRDVVRECREPLALTSANISNGRSTVSVQEFTELWPSLDVVFDGGTLGTSAHSRLGSTVVDLSKAGTYTIIREGSAYSKTVESLRGFGLVEEQKS